MNHITTTTQNNGSLAPLPGFDNRETMNESFKANLAESIRQGLSQPQVDMANQLYRANLDRVMTQVKADVVVGDVLDEYNKAKKELDILDADIEKFRNRLLEIEEQISEASIEKLTQQEISFLESQRQSIQSSVAYRQSLRVDKEKHYTSLLKLLDFEGTFKSTPSKPNPGSESFLAGLLGGLAANNAQASSPIHKGKAKVIDAQTSKPKRKKSSIEDDFPT